MKRFLLVLLLLIPMLGCSSHPNRFDLEKALADAHIQNSTLEHAAKVWMRTCDSRDHEIAALIKRCEELKQKIAEGQAVAIPTAIAQELHETNQMFAQVFKWLNGYNGYTGDQFKRINAKLDELAKHQCKCSDAPKIEVPPCCMCGPYCPYGVGCPCCPPPHVAHCAQEPPKHCECGSPFPIGSIVVNPGKHFSVERPSAMSEKNAIDELERAAKLLKGHPGNKPPAYNKPCESWLRGPIPSASAASPSSPRLPSLESTMTPAFWIAVCFSVAVGCFRPYLIGHELPHHLQHSYEAISHLLVGGWFACFFTGRRVYKNIGYLSAFNDDPASFALPIAVGMSTMEVLCVLIKLLV